MKRLSGRRKPWILVGVVVVAVAAVLAGLSSGSTKSPPTHPPRLTPDDTPAGSAIVPANAVRLSVGGPMRVKPVPAGFVGLSIEYSAFTAYAGKDPNAPDPVLEQLIRNLNPGQSPVLRIGGDTTDWTWYPVPHMTRPRGVRISLDRAWVGTMATLANTLGARLILGINLEAKNRRLSAYEARTLINGIGRSRIAALEIGNEPELYGSLAWYVINGHKYYGRPHSYSFNDYLHDVAQIRSALPSYALAGPAVGGKTWIPDTGRFISAEPRLRIVTLHHYPLQQCFKSRSTPWYPTVAHILAPRATRGLADSVGSYVRLAHKHGLPLRIGEMNSMSCGSEHHVTDAFVSALWAVDALFDMARVGVDGVNIFSNPGAPASLFTFRRAAGHWTSFVRPDYYGLMMFAQAAPPGSRLLEVPGTAGRVKAWATRTTDGLIHVVLINDYTSRSRVISLRIPTAGGKASLARLTAPSLLAHRGVTLGGQGFGSATSTGLPAGKPKIGLVAPGSGRYTVKLPAASAAMLTLQAT